MKTWGTNLFNLRRRRFRFVVVFSRTIPGTSGTIFWRNFVDQRANEACPFILNNREKHLRQSFRGGKVAGNRGNVTIFTRRITYSAYYFARWFSNLVVRQFVHLSRYRKAAYLSNLEHRPTPIFHSSIFYVRSVKSDFQRPWSSSPESIQNHCDSRKTTRQSGRNFCNCPSDSDYLSGTYSIVFCFFSFDFFDERFVWVWVFGSVKTSVFIMKGQKPWKIDYKNSYLFFCRQHAHILFSIHRLWFFVRTLNWRFPNFCILFEFSRGYLVSSSWALVVGRPLSEHPNYKIQHWYKHRVIFSEICRIICELKVVLTRCLPVHRPLVELRARDSLV